MSTPITFQDYDAPSYEDARRFSRAVKAGMLTPIVNILPAMTPEQLREHYAKLLRQLPNHGELAVQRLDADIDVIVSSPSLALEQAFIWYDTPEGHLFWYNECVLAREQERIARSEQYATLRASARAKLTPEEAEACGL